VIFGLLILSHSAWWSPVPPVFQCFQSAVGWTQFITCQNRASYIHKYRYIYCILLYEWIYVLSHKMAQIWHIFFTFLSITEERVAGEESS
jgi:hypothetical protein